MVGDLHQIRSGAFLIKLICRVGEAVLTKSQNYFIYRSAMARGDSPSDPGRHPDHDSGRFGGLDTTWTQEDEARTFDAIVQRNPLHHELFVQMARVVEEIAPLRIVDVGGATGGFAKKLRDEGNSTRITIVDPAQAMLSLAAAKGLAGVETVCAEFGQYRIDRGDDTSSPDRMVTVVSSYALHNWTMEVRAWFFTWLRDNLHPGEFFVNGDIVADDPPGDEQGRMAHAHRFFDSVGARHWMADDSLPWPARANILAHTARHDLDRVPDLAEYVRLAGTDFSMEHVWNDPESYLRLMKFRRT